MMKYKGFIFDLNGTMIDDMDYHIKAWHRIINELGANISLERMKAECYGKNEELLERIFPGKFTLEEKRNLGWEKEKQYQQDYRPHLRLIDGLHHLLMEAKKQQIKMGIGSAAIRFNINFVVDGLNIRQYFDTFVSADDVIQSKPDPETFLKCANNLDLKPADCLVFEDSPKGAESAMHAGMDCVILCTQHDPVDFKALSNILAYHKDYTSFKL